MFWTWMIISGIIFSLLCALSTAFIKPKIGEIYVPKEGIQNPFDKDFTEHKVLEIKQNYVSYLDSKTGKVFSQETCDFLMSHYFNRSN